MPKHLAEAGHNLPIKKSICFQVVILCKKTGEIWLCVNYQKFNSTVVRDAFPLPRIDEALQAVHNYQWFLSFDMAHSYLQMPVVEAYIHKWVFLAGSLGLYKFTRIPFHLLNLGYSFCHLIEMCLGDQQFVTLLPVPWWYMHPHCQWWWGVRLHMSSVSKISNLIEKKYSFFQHSVVFLGYDLSADGISANPEKVEKVQNWPVPSSPKELNSFLGLASYYRYSIPNFAVITKCLHELVGPTHIKGDKKSTKTSEFQWTDKTRRHLIILKLTWPGHHFWLLWL